jgi:hypothetical protein
VTLIVTVISPGGIVTLYKGVNINTSGNTIVDEGVGVGVGVGVGDADSVGDGDVVGVEVSVGVVVSVDVGVDVEVAVADGPEFEAHPAKIIVKTVAAMAIVSQSLFSFSIWCFTMTSSSYI